MKKVLENKWTIIEMDTNNLIEYDKNNKDHWEKQISAIASSIDRFWYYNEIIVDKNNIVIAWHWRLATAKKMWYTHIKVKQLDIDTKEAGALRILDNMLSNFDVEDNLENIVLDLDSGIDLTLWDYWKDDFYPELNAPDYNPDDYLNDIQEEDINDWTLKVEFRLPNPEHIEEVEKLLRENFDVEIIKY